MKFRLAAAVLTAAALSVGMTSLASAKPVKAAARPPQVSGAKLQNALLPISAFGSDMAFVSSLNTGSKLATTRPKYRIPSMSCAFWEEHIYAGFLGDTGGALVAFNHPTWRSSYPETIIDGYEDVLQFASTATATTIFNQALARYRACQTFTEPVLVTHTATVSDFSVAKTTFGGNRAFTVTQTVTLSGFLQQPAYFNYLYVIIGTNIYSLNDFSGINDEPSPALMHSLIHRVQALY
jgi:hypothetical protein